MIKEGSNKINNDMRVSYSDTVFPVKNTLNGKTALYRMVGHRVHRLDPNIKYNKYISYGLHKLYNNNYIYMNPYNSYLKM